MSAGKIPANRFGITWNPVRNIFVVLVQPCNGLHCMVCGQRWQIFDDLLPARWIRLAVVLLADTSCVYLSGISATFDDRLPTHHLLLRPCSDFPQDYAAYLTHRLYHYPFLYRTFHKMHHKYKQPTAFSVTAIHPVELIHMELVLASPIILMPVHWSRFHFCVWANVAKIN